MDYVVIWTYTLESDMSSFFLFRSLYSLLVLALYLHGAAMSDKSRFYDCVHIL
jgi:hypothetical protein